jgi:hypothetical protein
MPLNIIKWYSIYINEKDVTGRSGCLNNIGAVFFIKPITIML